MDTKSVYGPSEALLKALQLVQGKEIAKTAGAVRQNFDQSVADITTQQQKRGVDFKGFTQPEYDRYFGANALPALNAVDAGVQDSGLQLANVLNSFVLNRGKTGFDAGDKEKQRNTDLRLGQQELRLNEQLSENQNQAEIEVARIAAAQAAAKSASSDLDKELSSDANTLLRETIGSDGNVSPDRYNEIKEYWARAGGDPQEFDNKFEKYVNKQHAKDYYNYRGFVSKRSAQNINVPSF